MANKDRIFLFWGEDLRQFEPGLLLSHSRAGETLLPVNAGAMLKARQAGLPFVLPEDWLGPENTLKARWVADDWETRWFEPARDALSSDGICWPVFDKEALNWYWRDLSLADAVVRTCRDRGVEKVSLVLNNPLRPALAYQRSDVHCHLIRAALNDRVMVRETFHDPRPMILSPAISLDRLRKGEETVSPERVAGRIVLALNPGEFHRFTPVIQELCSHFSGRTAIIALWPSPAETKAMAQSCPVDVFTPELAPALDVDLGRQFFTGYLKAVAEADGKSWAEALTLTRFQFEYYCGLRLPVLSANFRSWLNLWQSHRPAVVITSSLPDSESQLPALAADRAGIPTVSLPHGGFGAREQDCHARIVLYNCELTRRVYAAAGIDAERLCSCREVISQNEYPTILRPVTLPRKGWRVLVLTNPVKFDTCLFNTTMIGSQMSALQTLAKPPAGLSEKVDLDIKTHPTRHDQPLFELTDAGLAHRLLPPDAPLAEALDQTDLVVALNYSGTALIYALRARKPVIFYWNDPLLLRRSHSYRHSHLMLSAGEFVVTGEAFWRAVNRFFTDPPFAASLRDRADTFARDNIDSSADPSLSDILNEKMGISDNTTAPLTRRLVAQPIENIFPGVTNQPVDTTEYIFEYGGLPIEELQLLCGIIRACQPHTIFEIGTYKGATTLCMAANSQARIYTLDLPPKGHPAYTPPPVDDPELDVYPETPGVRFLDTPFAGRIRQIYGDSQTFDFSPYFESMDFVFVDACHHYEFALRDSMNAFKMIRPGGIIVWHDYAEWAPGVRRALQEVSRRFPLFHIAGTSLAVYMGERNREGQIYSQKDEGKITPPPALKKDGRMKGGSAPLFSEGVNIPLSDQTGESASDKSALLERIALSPGDINALLGLAAIEAGENNLNEALAFLQDALILDPAHERALTFKDSFAKRHKPEG